MHNLHLLSITEPHSKKIHIEHITKKEQIQFHVIAVAYKKVNKKSKYAMTKHFTMSSVRCVSHGCTVWESRSACVT